MTEKHFTIKNPFAAPRQNIYNLLHPQPTAPSSSPSQSSITNQNDHLASPQSNSPSQSSPTHSVSDSSIDNVVSGQAPLRPTTTADSFMSSVSRIESNGYGSSSSNNLYSYCLGKPRNLISSHSGTVTLALSLQEPCVFLTCCPPGASSYRDLGVDTGNHDAANTSDNHGATTSSSGNGSGGLLGLGSRSAHSSASTASTSASSDASTAATSTTSQSSSNQHSNSHSHSHSHWNHQPTMSPPDERLERLSDQPPSTLRGSILLKLTKPTKLKQISLSFYGVSKTVWSQTSKMSPLEELHNQPGAEVQDTVFVNCHDWEFLPDGSSTQSSPDSDQSLTTITSDIYGADAVLLKTNNEDGTTTASSTVRVKDPLKSETRHNHASRTVSDSNTVVPLFAPLFCPKRKLRHPATVSHKEAILFPAGEYVYNFTLAIDANTPETVNVPHGSIQYFLVPKVVRAGPFALNLQSQQEVELVRSPPNNYDTSFNNPIVISRIWDSRLHYEIVIPQKYITLGTSIPVAIKLTPLEKVMVHRVRIQVYETTQYRYSPEPHIDSTEVAVKLVLYEKKATSKGIVELTDAGYSRVDPKVVAAIKKAIPSYLAEDVAGSASGSSANSSGPSSTDGSANTSGGNSESASAGLSSSSEENIAAGSTLEGSASRKKLCGNLLNSGRDYDIDCEESTSTYFNCTIPLVADKETWPSGVLPAQYHTIPGTPISNKTVQYLRPDAISSPYIRVRHRLIVSFRISKQDRDDEKRRHFEVKIDTPINLLSPQCIGGNVELPLYNNFNADEFLSSGAIQDGPLGYLPSFDDALAAITDDELYIRPPLTQPPAVPSPPPEYSSLHFDS